MSDPKLSQYLSRIRELLAQQDALKEDMNQLKDEMSFLGISKSDIAMAFKAVKLDMSNKLQSELDKLESLQGLEEMLLKAPV